MPSRLPSSRKKRIPVWPPIFAVSRGEMRESVGYESNERRLFFISWRQPLANSVAATIHESKAEPERTYDRAVIGVQGKVRFAERVKNGVAVSMIDE